MKQKYPILNEMVQSKNIDIRLAVKIHPDVNTIRDLQVSEVICWINHLSNFTP